MEAARHAERAAKRVAEVLAKRLTPAAQSARDKEIQAQRDKSNARQARTNRVYFPNEIMYYVPWSSENASKQNNDRIAKIRCSPKLTKVEVKNWIEKLYDTPVKKVNTLNREGSIIRTKKGYYKRPDFKIAYVIMDEPWTPNMNKELS